MNTKSNNNTQSGELLGLNTNISISLKTELDADDLASIVASENEDRLLLERTAQETVVRDANRDVSNAEDELRELVQGVLDKYKGDDTSKALCKALKAFTGIEHATYTSDSTCVVEKKLVTFQVSIEPKRKDPSTSNGYGSSVVSKEVEISFNDKIKKQLKVIAKLRATATEEQAKLNSIMQMLTDLPRLKRRAKNNVLKGMLTGKIKTNADVLAAVESAAPKALPGPSTY